MNKLTMASSDKGGAACTLITSMKLSSAYDCGLVRFEWLGLLSAYNVHGYAVHVKLELWYNKCIRSNNIERITFSSLIWSLFPQDTPSMSVLICLKAK